MAKALRVLVMVGVGAGAGYWVAHHAATALTGHTKDPWFWPVMVALVPLSYWLATTVHELGHVIGGVSQGFRFLFLASGPLWVQRTAQGGLVARFNRLIATWGGLAGTIPTDAHDLTRRFSITVAGGPMFSLAFALGCWGLSKQFRPGLGELTCSVTALFSAMAFLASAQPFGAGGGMPSDGGRLLRLLGGGPFAKREAAMLGLTAASYSGTRPREWPKALLDDALGAVDDSAMRVAALIWSAQWLSDSGNAAAAAEAAVEAMRLATHLSPMLVSGLAGEAASTVAEAGDLARAKAFLDQASGPFVEDHVRLRAQAEIARLEGRANDAVRLAREGLQALERARFSPPSARERERLTELAQDPLTEGPVV